MVYSAVDDKEISLFEDISKFEASVLKEVEIAEAQCKSLPIFRKHTQVLGFNRSYLG